MNLWDRAQAELVDIIEWTDDSSDTMVWRFPRYENEIKNGAQLIVRQAQVAVFVSRGEIADIFASGQHQLTTRNLPLLHHSLTSMSSRLPSPVRRLRCRRSHRRSHRS